MSLASEIERFPLTIALDVRHPFAYLALRPALAFEREQGVEVNWLPIEIQTLRKPERDGEDRGTRHRRFRAQAIAREIEVYGAAQGLTLRDPYRTGSADAAHRAWMWMRDRHPERLHPWLIALFDAYWSEAVDPSSDAAVARLIGDAGGDAAGFAAWSSGEGRAAAGLLANELKQRGLYQTPAYLVEDEVFYGRQHLPMIRWILEGRSGPVPI